MEDQKKAKVMFTEEPQQKRQKVVGFAPAAQSSPNRENKSVHANGGPSHEKTLEKKASENSQSSHAQSSLSQPPPPALNPHLLVDDDDDDYIRRFSCAAQSAIKLSLVNRVGTSGESFNVLDEFSPEFCHQFFGLEETIVGYEDLKINIKFCEASMRCFVDTTFKSSLSNVDGTNNAAPRDPGTEAMIPPVYELYSAGGLPPSPHVTTSQAEFRKWLADDYCPPGTLYLRQGTYEIFHGTSADPKIAALHSRVEPLAMHFIDGSSCVDTSDPRWESFYLYEVKNGGAMGSVPTASSTSVSASTKTYRLLGYVTCFRFDNPFRERRLALRLCQLLIIPSRQGRGLGRLLYNAVQSYVDSNPNVFELSLEDPVPTVVHIRNCCDLDRAFSSKLLMFERPEQWVERRASGGGNYNENTDSGKEKSKFENEKNDEKDQIHETKNPKDRTKLWNQRALMHAGSDSVWKETMGKETMEQTTTTSVVEPLRIDFHLLDGSTQSKKLLYEMRRLLRTTTKQCCFVYEVIKLWHLKKHFEGEHLQLALKEFRIGVKQRLLKENESSFKELSWKEQNKQDLTLSLTDLVEKHTAEVALMQSRMSENSTVNPNVENPVNSNTENTSNTQNPSLNPTLPTLNPTSVDPLQALKSSSAILQKIKSAPVIMSPMIKEKLHSLYRVQEAGWIRYVMRLEEGN